MKMYIDKTRTNKWEKGEEEKLFDNIMELIAMHDYCYVGLGITERQQLDDVRSYHQLKEQMKTLKGMII